MRFGHFLRLGEKEATDSGRDVFSLGSKTHRFPGVEGVSPCSSRFRLISRSRGIRDQVLANAATFINDLRITVAAFARTWGLFSGIDHRLRPASGHPTGRRPRGTFSAKSLSRADPLVQQTQEQFFPAGNVQIPADGHVVLTLNNAFPDLPIAFIVGHIELVDYRHIAGKFAGHIRGAMLAIKAWNVDDNQKKNQRFPLMKFLNSMARTHPPSLKLWGTRSGRPTRCCILDVRERCGSSRSSMCAR